MVFKSVTNLTVCVVGLGYVGYPLAEAFSKHLKTIGYDISQDRINTLKTVGGHQIKLTNDPKAIRNAEIIIIAVPTPVTKAKDPDLSFIESSAKVVGQHLKKGAIVVLESTVFPGVTEEIVIPILVKESGLIFGKEFKVGYSPERINPGDGEHTIEKIIKIVSASDSESLETLKELYGLITNVYCAPNIKTAEAAKVIENIQRDINIALMNELALIFQKLKIDTDEVIKAAATKWNFLRFSPGLVGGHCIPVDPYYLVYKAKEMGFHPQVILAGRSTNDYMPTHVANLLIKGLNESGKVLKGSKVLILGLTYKENISDTRESPSYEIIKELKEFKINLFGYDPFLTKIEIEAFGIKYCNTFARQFDAVIITVAHEQFKEMTKESLESYFKDTSIVVDVRGIFKRDAIQGYYATL